MMNNAGNNWMDFVFVDDDEEIIIIGWILFSLMMTKKLIFFVLCVPAVGVLWCVGPI
jgi:hypothetical protein